jgi:hypothetical protein
MKAQHSQGTVIGSIGAGLLERVTSASTGNQCGTVHTRKIKDPRLNCIAFSYAAQCQRGHLKGSKDHWQFVTSCSKLRKVKEKVCKFWHDVDAVLLAWY